MTGIHTELGKFGARFGGPRFDSSSLLHLTPGETSVTVPS